MIPRRPRRVTLYLMTEEKPMRTHWTRHPLSRIGLVALALLAVALGAGPAGAAGTFRVAIGVDLDTVDPAQMTTTTVAQRGRLRRRRRSRSLGPDGKVSPWLAESWTRLAGRHPATR